MTPKRDGAPADSAAYAYGIARNHPFVDGNKRTAAVVGETFLTLNGYASGCHRCGDGRGFLRTRRRRAVGE
ncbi:type II toxin-antitoxin system death-on-curing family toxin [Sphingobium sp. AN641]|uniref:type II toxin-antitoxin system death-on-curing family toxin n=1 Tax=Sphingobium sp. AN641 TaxID=3133443 RepID=UPI004040AA0F